MASGILEKHSEVASFGAIQIESNEIMSTLKTSMYAHLGYDTKTKPRVLSENIKLLMDLGEDPAELSVKYLTWHEQRLHQRIASLTRCFDNESSSSGGGGGGGGGDPYQAMWHANSTFVSNMNVFLENHDEWFKKVTQESPHLNVYEIQYTNNGWATNDTYIHARTQ